MEKSIVNGHLVHGAPLRCCNSEGDADLGRLDDRREDFVEVNPGALEEAAHNSSGLVAFKLAISLEFMPEYPLACDNVCTAWLWYELPGLVLHEHPVLHLHRRQPTRIVQGGTHTVLGIGEMLAVVEAVRFWLHLGFGRNLPARARV
jgi:hypothetical protein